MAPRVPHEIDVINQPNNMRLKKSVIMETAIPIKINPFAKNSPHLLPFAINVPPKIPPMAIPMGMIVRKSEFIKTLFSFLTTAGTTSVRNPYEDGIYPAIIIPRFMVISHISKNDVLIYILNL